jgi:cell division septation protein DedD
MTTFRIQHKKNFTVISNSAIRDKSLSLKARGLHHLLLSYPDDWIVNEKALIEESDHDGRDAFRGAIKELEQANYLVRVQKRDPNTGFFAKATYNVFETPQQPASVAGLSADGLSVSGSSVSGSSVSGSSVSGSSVVGLSGDGKPDDILNTYSTKTDLTKTDLNKTPLTPQGGNAIAPLPEISQSQAVEPEQQETPPTVPVQAKQPRKKAKTGSGAKSSAAARARRKTEADQSPREFQQLWDDYRQFVIDVGSSVAGNYTKWEAIAQWDALLTEGDAATEVVEGTDWYIQCKKIEHQRKGEALGIPHLHRYLRDRKWEAALDHKRSVGGVLPKVAVAVSKTRSQQISENNSQVLDDWLASDDAAQSEFTTVEVQAYA